MGNVLCETFARVRGLSAWRSGSVQRHPGSGRDIGHMRA